MSVTEFDRIFIEEFFESTSLRNKKVLSSNGTTIRWSNVVVKPTVTSGLFHLLEQLPINPSVPVDMPVVELNRFHYRK